MRILTLVLAPVIAACAEGAQWPELRGIVHVDGPEKPAAVLVLPQSAAASRVKRAPAPEYAAILHAGGTDSGLDFGNIEVANIDVTGGVVRLRHGKSSETTELKLTALPKGEKYLVHLERSPLGIALECYQRLSGRTVIYSPQLPNAEVDVHIAADQDHTAALSALAKAIEMHEALVIPHGQKFAFAVPARHKRLVDSLPAVVATNGVPQDVVFPPGLIKFTSADVLQVLEFYSDLSGRTVLRPSYFAQGQLTLHSQTSLSQREAIWMVEAALRLCWLTTVPAGDKFVFVVPPERANDLPKFDASKRLPGQSGLIKFIDVDREQLLDAYAGVTGRKALPIEGKLPHAKFTLRSPAPLSPAEAAFAFEAIAALNNLAFQSVGEKEVKLVPLAMTVPRL
jgi:hypothetical protein